MKFLSIILLAILLCIVHARIRKVGRNRQVGHPRQVGRPRQVGLLRKGCGGDFTALSGKFTSPKYPKKYPNKKRCRYRFDTGYPIAITCSNFNLQKRNKKGCKRDYFKISESRSEIVRYCGRDGPTDYISTSSDVIILFRSNKKIRKRGFRCTYESIIPTTTSTSTSMTSTSIIPVTTSTSTSSTSTNVIPTTTSTSTSTTSTSIIPTTPSTKISTTTIIIPVTSTSTSTTSTSIIPTTTSTSTSTTSTSIIPTTLSTSTSTTSTSIIPMTTSTSTSTASTVIPDFLQSALDLYSSRTCYSTSRSTCGCTVTSEDSKYYTTTSGTYRIIAANGIPNHVYEVGQNRPNPNKACPHEMYMAVPLNPTKGTTYTTYGMGAVGIAISGGYFYNHLSTPNGDTAVINEGESFDTCKGHSDPTCKYHYHELPVCIAGDTGNCTFVGYMRDGFSVYTYCKLDPNSRILKSCYYLTSGDGSHSSHYTYSQTAYANGNCDLDQANGYTFPDERGYAYIFTEDYPFIMAGYYGTELANLCYLEDQ